MIAGLKVARWSFTLAQTSLAIITPGANEYVAVHKITPILGNSATGDVSLEVGFAVTTLPTVSENSATPGDGVFFSHAALPKGGGAVEPMAHDPFTGAVGVPVRLSCSAVTGSALRVVMAYRLIDTTPPA
jgi:hypothetical protein